MGRQGRGRCSAGAIGVALLAVLAACAGQDPTKAIIEPAFEPVSEPEPESGNVFVHLFEWRWPSIARECEEFLGPKGYSAVQVSPPQEHATGPEWYMRYQPVSYQLVSRSGTREQFVDMVERCAAVGVEIYVDAIINHMTGVYSGFGTAGTGFGEYDYPPLYGYDDFNHCGRNENDDIADFNDVWELQNCELVNLADLKTDKPGVQTRLAAYLNDLLGIGVAGFRLDAAKHMPPQDIAAILSLLDRGAFVFQEVIAEIDGPVDLQEYVRNASVTEFQYLPAVHKAFGSGDLRELRMLGPDTGLLPSDKAVVFVDNHDTQRHDGGHGFNYKKGARYTLANIFMLAWPYGYPKVMSSYDFSERNAGPPDVEPVSSGASGCNTGWVCEHRRPAIANMVRFRATTSGARVTHWKDHGNTAISFGRGDVGHVVINAGALPIDVSVATDLPPGEYCDVILHGGRSGCTDRRIVVSDEGRFRAQLDPLQALAILRPL